MAHRKRLENRHRELEASPGSMLFSVLLVALSIAFVFGFKYFLAGRTYEGPQLPDYTEDSSGGQGKDDKAYKKDKGFRYHSIMVQKLGDKVLAPVAKPGDKPDRQKALKEGQILAVKSRGEIDGKDYYLLEDGSWLEDNRTLMPLKESIPLKGYITITYISTSGVHLRKWADFEADNIVESVYVGDRVEISRRVTTVTDIEAYVTKDGYYITTNSRYLNDHTTVVEDKADKADKSNKPDKSDKAGE